MATTQPAQPNQPQYQISALYLFPVYSTRAAYQQATGQQAPPFDPTRPVKQWLDPAPSGQPYNVFNPNATNTKYVSQLSMPTAQAGTVNLPGVYIYPPYVPAPTDAMEYGPSGPLGVVSPDQICLASDAQEILNEIQSLYPNQKLSVQQQNTGVFYYVFGSDPRRAWYIMPATGWQANGICLNAQQLIEAKYANGVGAPGHWTLVGPNPRWVYDPPVVEPPPTAAIPVAVPIRALLPNEQIVNLPGSLFNPGGTWVVERTDMSQPQAPETTDQQFADLKSTLSAIRTTLGAIQLKMGA
jgi:hypothetical protein